MQNLLLFKHILLLNFDWSWYESSHLIPSLDIQGVCRLFQGVHFLGRLLGFDVETLLGTDAWVGLIFLEGKVLGSLVCVWVGVSVDSQQMSLL